MIRHTPDMVLLMNEIKAALGPDWETRLDSFWIKQIALHLVECGWTKHDSK